MIDAGIALRNGGFVLAGIAAEEAQQTSKFQSQDGVNNPPQKWPDRIWDPVPDCG